MKRTKVYRPRRGMRFSHGKRGVSPTVGFVAGPAVTRTRPSSVDSSNSSVIAGAAVMQSTVAPNVPYEPFSPVVMSSSLALQGSISMGRLYERGKLNAQLISSPTNFSGGVLPGTPPWPSTFVMDTGISSGTPSGTFILGVPGRASPPSWTHSYLGKNQAFVIDALTSSNHTNIVLNTYTSGTEILEATAAPAPHVIHSSKEQRFQTIVVKKSASFFDTVINQFNSSSSGGTYAPPAKFSAGEGTLISDANNPSLPANSTGSDAKHPTVITLDVPVSGRLVDIKVWVELQHASSSGWTPLGTLGIALQSPNVRWNGWSTPIDNDPLLNTISNGGINVAFTQAEFWKNSFVLWEGPGLFASVFVFDGGTMTPTTPMVDTGFNGNVVWRTKFAAWDRDLGMRTVFSDGATVLNPRMNYSTNAAVGPVAISGNFIGSPNAALGINSAWGIGTVWTGSTGSPPRGWLNGAGGVADVNEWPTTGTNNGTQFIRPVYPLLDPVFQVVPQGAGVTYPTSITDGHGFPQLVNFAKVLGVRPGLRGTEISGTWRLLFACSSGAGPATYFRQGRLEITYETGISGERFNRRAPSRNPRGATLLYSVSGCIGVFPLTASLDTRTNIPQQDSIFRTFGLGPNSGSANVSNALLYRLSGSLADIVGQTPDWLFTGPNGMPIIPESSASLVPYNRVLIASSSFSDFIQPRQTIDQSQNLSSIADSTNPPQSLRQLAATFVSSSTT